MYIKVTNEVIENYSIGQLRKDNPQTSFPKNPTNALLAEWNVFPVKPTNAPSVDHTKNIQVGIPVKQGNEYVQVWEVTDATAEEIESRIKEKADSVRAERDAKIAETDWTALSDVTMSPAMTIYRQALRDVPSQEGFPWNVTWPSKPE